MLFPLPPSLPPSYPSTRSVDDSHVFVWSLLSTIAQEEKQDLRRYLCRAMEYWARQGRLTATLVKDICSHTASEDHLMVSHEAACLRLVSMSQGEGCLFNRYMYSVSPVLAICSCVFVYRLR